MKSLMEDAGGSIKHHERLVRLLPPRWVGPCERVVKVVAAEYGITPERLLSRNRSERVCGARMVAMHLAREITHVSWMDLGVYFERDRCSVLNGWRVIRDYASVYPEMHDLVEKLRAKLESP